VTYLDAQLFDDDAKELIIRAHAKRIHCKLARDIIYSGIFQSREDQIGIFFFDLLANASSRKFFLCVVSRRVAFPSRFVRPARN